MEDILNNPIKYKGIELAVKTVKKRYPFIMDWRFNEYYRNYTHALFLDFKIDWIKLSEYSGYPINPAYLKNTPTSISTLGGLYDLKEKNPIDVVVAEDEKFEYFYELKKSINDKLDFMYKSLPNDMVVKWRDSGFEDVIMTPIAQDFY